MPKRIDPTNLRAVVAEAMKCLEAVEGTNLQVYLHDCADDYENLDELLDVLDEIEREFKDA